MEKGIIKWRIENFSQWCGKVHGECIRSPNFYTSMYFCKSSMQLYPKGISGQGERLVVRLCGISKAFSGELSIFSSDGSLLCKQQVNAEGNRELPGPKFENVLSRIREREDFITVILRNNNSLCLEIIVLTTINFLKISLEINGKEIEKNQSDETRDIFYIQSSPNGNLKRMWLKICSKNNKVNFTIAPPIAFMYNHPFAVEMCLRLTRSDGTVDSCVKEEHVFFNDSPWTFPDPLEKKELIGKEISLLLCLKTKHLIQSPIFMKCAYSCVSIESKNKICFPEKASSTDPVTSNKVKVLTKDSGSQTSVTSNLAEDSVLSKDLMCVYQDQDFSDFQLKCDVVTFPVHKVILSARSPVFKTMLSTDMRETASSEVVIEDLDPSSLSCFLTYLYTGAVEELQCDRALKLYYAADKYQVPSLKMDCSKFLRSNVSISNVCDILSLANKHGDDQLTSAAHDFILNNFNDVLKSNEWESFMGREPLLAVKTVTHFAAKDRVRMHDP